MLIGLTYPANSTVGEFLELVKNRFFPKERFINHTLVAVFDGKILKNDETIYPKAEIYVTGASRMNDPFAINALRRENFERFMSIPLSLTWHER